VLVGLFALVTAHHQRNGPFNDQSSPGPVLLVPGYGADTGSLETLSAALQRAGRTVLIVSLPGNAQGEIDVQAQTLSAAVDSALASSQATTVDLVGYSEGGLVTRDYVKRFGGRTKVRRVVTLGSPHHGTHLASLGAQLQPSLCPTACQEMVPGSSFLKKLNGSDETPPGPTWVAIYTSDDEVVTPPTSGKLDGALNIKVQSICANTTVGHGGLPTTPVTVGMVLRELAPGDPVKLTSADCSSLASTRTSG